MYQIFIINEKKYLVFIKNDIQYYFSQFYIHTKTLVLYFYILIKNMTNQEKQLIKNDILFIFKIK